MVQRYMIEDEDGRSIWALPDANGEYVEWCDVEHLLDDWPLTPEHMTEAGWTHDQMSFAHSKKLKEGGLLVRSASQTYLLVDSNVRLQRCQLKHVETVSDFRRLCETFGI